MNLKPILLGAASCALTNPARAGTAARMKAFAAIRRAATSEIG